MTQRHLSRWLLAVLLAAPVSLAAQPAQKEALAKSAILESNVAYFRVATIGPGLPADLQSAQQTLSATNQLIGAVLDLRFAEGSDGDSAKAAENFLSQVKLPLAILVNNKTSEIADELALHLRADKAGLIFGSSGEINPDIPVVISPDAEKKFMDNPYGTFSTNDSVVAENNTASSALNHTNTASDPDYLPYVDHTTEADLVREKIKDGLQESDFAPPDSAVPSEQPFIRDPALARGVDFIKGLAALRRTRS